MRSKLSTMSLLRKAFFSLAIVQTFMGAVLFFVAQTIYYWQAWLFMTVYGACSIFAVSYLWKHDRALLERRMRGGPLAEGELSKKIIMVFASLGFVALLVVPALDHRLRWSQVPPIVVVLGNLFVVAGYYFVHLVLRENSFAAATIKVVSEQRVISTGLYGFVRHPMYSGMLILLAGMPLALGSYWGLVVLAGMVPVLVWRLLEEEKFLAKNLPGYTEYQAKVRWRLIPRIF